MPPEQRDVEQNPDSTGSAGVESAAERRKEARYPAQAPALVHREGGETIQAMATNISSSGMRLSIEGCPLHMDETVTVDVQLPDEPDKPFSAWGLGRVAYVDRVSAGIQLFGGEFASRFDE